MVEQTLRAMLLLLHVLAAAAWFGSIFYSLFVLYPRLPRHFAAIEERERFLLTLSQGARWNMVAALSLVALSGIGLVLMPRNELTLPWLTMIGAKTGLMLVTAILFWRVSWHWWPARLFAMPGELPALHRRFRIGAVCMLVLVGLNMALGVLAK